jgi:PqqD family protein of HPr-rel-A system
MTWKRDPGLPFQTLEEETIVVDPRTREVHLLNDTAARIWELLGSAQSVDELTRALGEEYDAPADELRAGVEELLAGFSEKGLLVGSEGR